MPGREPNFIGGSEPRWIRVGRQLIVGYIQHLISTEHRSESVYLYRKLIPESNLIEPEKHSGFYDFDSGMASRITSLYQIGAEDPFKIRTFLDGFKRSFLYDLAFF